MADEQDFLDVLTDEFTGTVEVSEKVGLSRRQTSIRLNKLEDKGLVEKKKEGGNLYWKLSS